MYPALMAKQSHKLNRVAPWRFIVFFGMLIIVTAGATPMLGLSEGFLSGFDLAAAIFLLSCIPTLRREAEDMRLVAERSDANPAVLLVVSALVTLVTLSAVVAELGLRGQLTLVGKLLIVLTLILVWLFANTVYAFHYAHLFYSRGQGGADRAGLKFPGTNEPMMSDFAYFAFTLGVAAQTSDVQVTSRHIRNVVTVHCVVGFFFNLGVLALTINVLGAS